MATLNQMPSNTILVQDNNLVSATLHRRYKRFLADCEVVFCPNTGPMTGLLDNLPCPAKLSVSDKPGRKYRYAFPHTVAVAPALHRHTLEWVQPQPDSPTWVGVHSARANHYVTAMLNRGLLQPLLGVSRGHSTRREVPYGTRSRVDFVLEGGDCSMYVEVKSVTMTQHGVAVFPDTVSTRAQQHARELTALLTASTQGNKRRRLEVGEEGTTGKGTKRAAMLFVVQRDDAEAFAPCRVKDPEYAALCVAAKAAGVQLVAVAIRLDEHGAVRFVGELPVVDPL